MDIFIYSSTFFTITHLFGVVLGAGGAFMSDAMFFTSVKDERISKTELRFLRLGSIMVWIGLTVIVISGFGIFLSDIEKYSTSSKFLAKMSIVAIITLNGIFFHLYHFPRLMRHVGIHFPSSDEFIRKAPLLLGSGVVSVISWTSAFILGALPHVPYGYTEIIGVYLFLIFSGLLCATVFRKRLLPHHKNKH